MSNKIKIVTTESNTKTINDIFIGGTTKYPYLAYRTEMENGTGVKSVIISAYKKTPYRPIHCSELYNKLKSRAWNKVDGCRYILPTDGGRLFYRAYDNDKLVGDALSLPANNNGIDSFSRNLVNESGQIIGKTDYVFEIKGEDYSGCEEIIEKHKELFGTDEVSVGEEMYSSVNNSLSFVDDTIRIEPIRYNSDIYTDTVSLKEYTVLSARDRVSCTVNFTVQYSKDESIYTKDLSISVFDFNNPKAINMDDCIETINDEVNVELFDGVLRVFPITNDVNECIIARCEIILGRGCASISRLKERLNRLKDTIQDSTN